MSIHPKKPTKLTPLLSKKNQPLTTKSCSATTLVNEEEDQITFSTIHEMLPLPERDFIERMVGQETIQDLELMKQQANMLHDMTSKEMEMVHANSFQKSALLSKIKALSNYLLEQTGQSESKDVSRLLQRAETIFRIEEGWTHSAQSSRPSTTQSESVMSKNEKQFKSFIRMVKRAIHYERQALQEDIKKLEGQLEWRISSTKEDDMHNSVHHLKCVANELEHHVNVLKSTPTSKTTAIQRQTDPIPSSFFASILEELEILEEPLIYKPQTTTIEEPKIIEKPPTLESIQKRLSMQRHHPSDKLQPRLFNHAPPVMLKRPALLPTPKLHTIPTKLHEMPTKLQTTSK